MFPIEHDDVWGLYKRTQSALWVAQEISFKNENFDTLTADEQHLVKTVLAFFAASDGIVIENIAAKFQHEVQAKR